MSGSHVNQSAHKLSTQTIKSVFRDISSFPKLILHGILTLIIIRILLKQRHFKPNIVSYYLRSKRSRIIASLLASLKSAIIIFLHKKNFSANSQCRIVSRLLLLFEGSAPKCERGSEHRVTLCQEQQKIPLLKLIKLQ